MLMYETLKRIYKKTGDKKAMRRAYKKGWLTKEQYKKITGEDYDNPEPKVEVVEVPAEEVVEERAEENTEEPKEGTVDIPTETVEPTEPSEP